MAKKRESTALVVQAPSEVSSPLPSTNGRLPDVRQLTEDVDVSVLGVAEITLTPKEETVLSEAVAETDVSIKPTGQPYLSHTVYTRWFNRAFGRTGWSLVPASKPMRSEQSVVCPYLMYVHHVPVAYAVGEQQYHEGNRDQTYGDALEATVASALRRCGKRLGVGLELWDRRWIQDFVREHAIKVKVQVTRDGRTDIKYQWRRKDEPPFWNEVEPTSHAPAQKPPPVAHTGTEDQPITPKERARLWAIIRSSGRSETEVREWLLTMGISSTAKIPRAQYEYVCNAIEHPGPVSGREPGQDDA